MPTITFSLKDMQGMLGKTLSLKELQKLLEYAKAEVEGQEGDEVTVKLDDTNQAYLWSVEGIARLIKGVLGKEKGLAKINIKKAGYKLIVDSSVKNVRPYVAAFVAKGKKVDDYLIKQIIQLQEKLCENYGRKREKVAIGVYSYGKIKFPVHYKATDPESIKFIPLDFRKEMTQQEILEDHPKGRDYAWILEGCKKHPILVDDKGDVLSFPPIINSAETGKIEENDKELFFEATGTDLNSVLLATNIFAYALFDRGFDIYGVDVKYGSKTITTPRLFNETIKVKKEQINKMLGLDLKDSDIKKLLEKARFGFKNYRVEIPSYRLDILHPVDIVEEVAIMYGYDKIKPLPLKGYTIGSTSEMVKFRDKVREIVSGLGFQEVFSPMLTNKTVLYDKMNIKDFGTAEIKEYMSESYSVVRSWLLPIMLEVLSKNKHIDYPQKIFEQGLISARKNKITDYERIAIASCHGKADFTEIKQVLDYTMRMLGVEYEIKETAHDSFIPGRVGRVSVKGKDVAYIGEISPAVLTNWGIEMPVAALELNLTDLFGVME